MKILITGCNGFLGSKIIKNLSNSAYELIGTSLNDKIPTNKILFKKGDLSDLEFAKDLIKSINPDIIINTVGWTDVDSCEEHPEKAYKLNVITAENIAKSIEREDVKLIHVSSDQLFDGTKSFYSEEDIPSPLNVYGETKLESERVCLKYHKNTIIVRTNFFGETPEGHKASFSEWILNSLRDKKEIKMFKDIFFSPIEISFLVKAIEQVFSSNYSGVLNIVGNERISKYNFGVKLAKKFGFDTELIIPSEYSDSGIKTNRPIDMSLSVDRYKVLFNFPLPDIDNSLERLFLNNSSKETIIMGAGLAGLSTAYHLEKNNNRNYLLLESSSGIGGLCKTINKEGFFFDLSIHLLHIKKEEILQLSKELLGENLIIQDRRAGILLNDKIIPYPFQYNLFHLDKEIKDECLNGALESAKNFDKDKIPANFEEWINLALGTGIAKHFMIPYNKKCYSIDPSNLDVEIVGKYVPKLNPDEIIQGAESDMSDNQIGYNCKFYYPKDGILTLSNAFAKKISNLRTDEEITKIDIHNKILITSKGNIYNFVNLVSTIPLKKLIKIIDDVPKEIKDAAENLHSNKVCAVLLGVKRPNLSAYHWIYLPQENILPYRLSFPMNYSENMAPEGSSSICAEISYMGKMPFSKSEIIYKTINDLIQLKILKKEDEIIFRDIIELDPSYVVFDFKRKESVRIIQDFLNKNGIYSIGRYGAWDYSAMEDAIFEGIKTAEKILTN